MSFQLSILKILAGQPEGRASLAVLKDYLAVFYTSGPEWTARMKRLAERAPDLNIFGQKLVARESGQWIITEKGRALLGSLEQMAMPTTQERALEGSRETPLASKLPVLPPALQRRSASRRRRGQKQPRTRDDRSA
ncbi:hypothetical protein CO683_41460 [Bradyrhizobium ottawaense]|nr:hypothetical protein [Bradyrhizobium sp. CCBAU 11361]MDA9537084.1 hypothetical protein [Bradyrhizobium sp. CCBAU 21362]PDT63941.1 hypothetical protein CO683_41460 [Bradyrhizobium ottawaense]QHP73035.1 hypothetical protein EI171_40490 [Bradyrhizobium sp. LCT2]